MQEKVLIGKRLAEARSRLGLTLPQLCERVNQQGIKIGKSGMNYWELGKRQPNAEQFLALCRALEITDISAYFGVEPPVPELDEAGMKKLDDYKADLIASGRYTPRRWSDNIRYITMPVSLLSVSAGTGAFLDEGSFEMIEVPESTVPVGAKFGVRVRGDSMEPIYRDDQLVWVQPCEELRPGEVGIFLYDGSGYVKAYDEQEPDDAEAFTGSDGVKRMQPVLISYNPAYAPIRVSPEAAFSIAGRVLNR